MGVSMRSLLWNKRLVLSFIFFLLLGCQEELLKNGNDTSERGLQSDEPENEMATGNSTQDFIYRGHYYALLIANQGYVLKDNQRQWGPLKTPINGAEKIKTLLLEEYGFKQVKLLADADERVIHDAFNVIQRELKPNDSIMIFYAGHGYYDQNKRGYWVPTGLKEAHPVNYIPNSTILDFIENIARTAKHTLLISDSCFSGSLFNPVRSSMWPSQTNKNERFFRDKLKIKSVQLMSSAGDEYVDDQFKQSGMSSFTYYFYQTLKDNSERYLDFETFSLKIKKDVKNNSGQSPHFGILKKRGHKLGGDFVFIRDANRKCLEYQKEVKNAADLGDIYLTQQLIENDDKSCLNSDQKYYWLRLANENARSIVSQDMGRTLVMAAEMLSESEEKKGLFDLYSKAAELGDPTAMQELAEFYDNDRFGIKKDTEKAKFWRAKAIPLLQLRVKKGDMKSEYALGRTFFIRKQYDKGIKWIKLAAEKGYAKAQKSMGNIFFFGNGVEVDNELAFYWYQKAAKNGYTDAYIFIGFMHEQGLGVERDTTKALEWYQKAASNQNSHGYAGVGRIYESGLGVDKNYKIAADWYHKSAEMNNGWGHFRLGWLYQHGLGVEQDNNQAVIWYREAISQGVSLAYSHLGEMYELGKGVEKNEKIAMDLYQKAANNDESEGAFKLAKIYIKGTVGGKVEHEKAISWYKKSAQWGKTDAWVELGNIYRDGIGVNQNYEKAKEWYLKAVEKNSLYAFENLGYMYQTGKSIAIDFKTAVLWYEKAAGLNGDYAMFQLGQIYRLGGYGVEKDLTKAKKWYVKADQSGHKEAKKELALLK